MLKHQYDKLEEIPETFRELYTEKNGKWELTGVSGVRTQADVDRVTASLEKERNDHKETKAKLTAWGELGELDDVHKRLDRLPELEAAAKGKLDEAQIEDLVNRRVDGVIKSRTAPLERQIAKLTGERDELNTKVADYQGKERQRSIHDAIRKAAAEEKIRPEAIEDALVWGERVFDVAEDGAVVTRDGVGVTPGLQPKDWLGEIRERKTHWWPASTSGGATGSGGRGATAGADNPWSAEGWNMTKQGEVMRTAGRDRAEQLAKLAGTSIGGPRPAAKKV